MLFVRVEATGLSHFSYVLGDGTQAIVIDPQRDYLQYIKIAADAGMRITHILETHRNEDFCIGSVELADCTKAQIWHADKQLDYEYGHAVIDGQEWTIGGLVVRSLHTPGHTPGSMSYVLHEMGGHPWMIFTGDTLFSGDVGRTDLLGKDHFRELTGLLYDSIFHKILPLGEGVLVFSAHGPGSACGTQIADRPWTTIGLEKQLNPRLSHKNKETFVAGAAILERPPYFLEMEQHNIKESQLPPWFPNLDPLTARECNQQADAVIVDVRNELSFAGAHIPGAFSIWLGGLAQFAGWFLPYEKPLLLVGEEKDIQEAARTLVRLGFDQLIGYLSAGMVSWHKAGYESARIDTIVVQELCRLLDAKEDPWILDVRAAAELERDGRIPDAHHMHLTQLPAYLDDIPRDKDIYIFCASGVRSMVAASLLRRHGIVRVRVVLGGFSGWSSITCPITK